MPSQNKEIIKKHRDAWYRRNKEKQLKRQKERRAELRKWFHEYKRTLCCLDCGFLFKDHPECCDFHHRDGSLKRDTVGQIIANSKKLFLEEREKCDPLCANCHRIRHVDLYSHMK